MFSETYLSKLLDRYFFQTVYSCFAQLVAAKQVGVYLWLGNTESSSVHCITAGPSAQSRSAKLNSFGRYIVQKHKLLLAVGAGL